MVHWWVLVHCGPRKGEPQDYCHSLQKVMLMTGILILFGKVWGFEIGVRQQNLQSKDT
jgi:hypothetical protein